MRSATRISVVLLAVAACGNDKKPEPSAAKPTETEPEKTPAPPATDEGSALAAKAKQRVSIAGLGLSIEVPEGTTVTPPRDADEGSRRANLKQGAFMVNVFAVDAFSTPDFAKAKEVDKADKLVASIRAEATPTGWIVFREIVSGMYNANRFELTVRTEVGGKKWECGVSAPSKPLAELALAACQTLSGEAPTQPSPKPTPKVAKPSGPLTKETIGEVIRGGSSKARRCYERELVTNPKLVEVTVTTKFMIGANGKVMATSVSGADGQLARCVAGVFQGMQFPAPADGRSVPVSYPYHFTTAK